MQYTVKELLWLFFTYSVLGWVLETVKGAAEKKCFVNRGFTTGPVCFVYGVAAVLMTVTLQELKGSLIFLFLGSMVVATAVEWFTGKGLERLNRRKWWDYSDKKWNFDGYICLQYSLLWGALGVCTVRCTDRWLVSVFRLLPGTVETGILTAAVVMAVLDIFTSAAAVLHIRKNKTRENLTQLNRGIARLTYGLGERIAAHVERRMERAYPAMSEAVEAAAPRGVFAEGCGFYKLFWLFLTGAVLGDLVETVFCRLTAGVWMSRSSLVWGPFSIVWGLAIAVATALLYKDRDKPDRHIFVIGTVLGGAYEYICSVLTELVFGKVFWDYSAIPFNLGGRINLLYCFFWGIAALVWIKGMYPYVSGWIEKIPVLPGCILTWILVVFMAVNMTVSSAALIRYDSRGEGKQASNAAERILDDKFGDERMARIYPNAISR